MSVIHNTVASVRGLNGTRRDLCAQFRKKGIDDALFFKSAIELVEHARNNGYYFDPTYNTFVPEGTDKALLADLHSNMADLIELHEMMAEAFLLRSGALGLDPTEWELRWFFLMERANELGHHWNPETKKFV